MDKSSKPIHYTEYNIPTVIQDDVQNIAMKLQDLKNDDSCENKKDFLSSCVIKKIDDGQTQQNHFLQQF